MVSLYNESSSLVSGILSEAEQLFNLSTPRGSESCREEKKEKNKKKEKISQSYKNDESIEFVRKVTSERKGQNSIQLTLKEEEDEKEKEKEDERNHLELVMFCNSNIYFLCKGCELLKNNNAMKGRNKKKTEKERKRERT